MGSANAQTPSVHWTAPEPCPSEENVRQIVARWIAQSPEQLDTSSIHARARVRREEQTWVLDLDVESSGEATHETLTAERCEALVQVVALKVALAAMPVENIPEPDAVGERQPVNPPRQPRSEDVWGLRVPLGVTVGVLPKAAPSAALFGFSRFSVFRFEIGASYGLPQRVEYTDVPGVGADVDLFAGAVRICPTAKLDSIEMLLCGGAQAGALRGSGFGVDEVRTAYEAWAAVQLGSAAVFTLSRDFKLWTGADALLSVVRPAFRMRNLPVLYQPDDAGFQAWAGLEYWFR